MHRSQVLLACVIGVLISFLNQQPSAAQPARPGSRITLPGALQTLGPSLRARSSAPYKQYVESIRNPPKPPSTTVKLQPYIANTFDHATPIPTSQADIAVVNVGGTNVLRFSIHNVGITSVNLIASPGATVVLPSTEAVPSTGAFVTTNIKPTVVTNVSLGTASSSPRMQIIYSAPPNFTEEKYAILGANQLPAEQRVAQPDGSINYTWTRLGWVIDNTLFQPIPAGARIKKLGFTLTGYNNAEAFWDLKNFSVNGKTASFDLSNGVPNAAPFEPYNNY